MALAPGMLVTLRAELERLVPGPKGTADVQKRPQKARERTHL